MKESDFIEQMVHETIQREKIASSSELRFEEEVDYKVYLSYHSSKKSFSFSYENKIIEFPQNWGPFKNRISTQFSIYSEEDKYFILDIINSILGSSYNSIQFVILANSETQLSNVA